MEILPLNQENLTDCVQVFMAAYNSAPWNYEWTQADAFQYLSEYMSTPYYIGFILYDEQSPVGAVLGHTKTWWTNKQLMIDEFFITSAKQRSGYGKKLMDYCSNYAEDKGVELLILMTNKYMPAYKFYDKLNYVTAEQYVFMFKPL